MAQENTKRTENDDKKVVAPSVLSRKEVPFLDQAISFRGNEVFDQYGCAVMMNWENDVMVLVNYVLFVLQNLVVWHASSHAYSNTPTKTQARSCAQICTSIPKLLPRIDSKRSIFDGRDSLTSAIEPRLSECGIWHGLDRPCLGNT